MLWFLVRIHYSFLSNFKSPAVVNASKIKLTFSGFAQNSRMKKKTVLIFGIPIGLLAAAGAALLAFFLFAPPPELEGGKLTGKRLTDGTFVGHYRSGPNRAEVEVTVKGGRIVEINVVRNVGSWIGKQAVPAVPDQIIAQQSTDVDAVTGATRSSRVIMNAVENAVRKSVRYESAGARQSSR